MAHDRADSTPHAWRMLVLVALAELLVMSLWFTASAVGAELERVWALDPEELAWLTTTVQIGFVAGTATAALLNLADLIPSRLYMPACAILAAACNLAFAFVPSYGAAVPLRLATGFFLAGVYPPAMKMVATWFRSNRGLAIGTVVGALTAGKAVPYLLRLLGGVEAVSMATSSAALVGGLAVLATYRDGPYAFERRPFAWVTVSRVMCHRPTMLATAGYLGHMWELYAMWTWVPAFLVASAAVLPPGERPSELWVSTSAFGAIAVGAVGCLWGGRMADRIGRERFVNVSMGASGACAAVVGLLFGGPFWAVSALCLVWGFFVVADSAQFSALVTEVAPRDAVGTALTLQTSFGFLLTMATIQAVPHVVDGVGWPWAFVGLALGPAAGIAAMRRLRSIRIAPA